MIICIWCNLTDEPLPVSQRCDDQPFSAAQELVLIDEADVRDVDDHLVRVLVEVETTLLQPLKVIGAFDVESALEADRRKGRWTEESREGVVGG